MTVTRSIATAVTTAALVLAMPSISAAGDQYSFPSASGVQLSGTQAATFVAPATGAAPTAAGVSVGNVFVYGQPSLAKHDQPLPLPGFAYAPGPATPYAGRLMSHALMVAPYANYAADYARLFAPSYAVSAWTERVFGVVDSGYTAVDGWTAAAYGMPRIQGPHRRGESAPDLSLMPTLRAHPELEQARTFKHQGN